MVMIRVPQKGKFVLGCALKELYALSGVSIYPQTVDISGEKSIKDYMDMSILQSYDLDTVSSVFYQIRSYNRKNLYLQEFIVLIFCNTYVFLRTNPSTTAKIGTF